MPGVTPAPRTVLFALVASAAGHVLHNLAEFPPSILLGAETLFPLVVTVAVGAAMRYAPGRPTYAVALAWAVVVIVLGGGTVLPLGVLPFVPEQSLSHYLTHVAYAVMQVPLLRVAYRGVSTRPAHAEPGAAV